MTTKEMALNFCVTCPQIRNLASTAICWRLMRESGERAVGIPFSELEVDFSSVIARHIRDEEPEWKEDFKRPVDCNFALEALMYEEAHVKKAL